MNYYSYQIPNSDDTITKKILKVQNLVNDLRAGLELNNYDLLEMGVYAEQIEISDELLGVIDRKIYKKTLRDYLQEIEARLTEIRLILG